MRLVTALATVAAAAAFVAIPGCGGGSKTVTQAVPPPSTPAPPPPTPPTTAPPADTTATGASSGGTTAIDPTVTSTTTSTGTTAPTTTVVPTGPDPEEVARQKAERFNRQQARLRACARDTEPLVVELENLDNLLDDGLTIKDYASRLLKAKENYDRTVKRIERLGPGCLANVAAPAEKALRAYFLAFSTWNTCVKDPNCTTDSIRAELQLRWKRASKYINQSRGGLESIRPKE